MGELTFYIGDSQERVYVKLPVNKVKNAPRSKCKFVGALKCWKTNAKTLTDLLDNKRKSPINFCDEGLCWTFYFDEAEGALYNEVNDKIPILQLDYMPQQELNRNVDKEDNPICVQTLVRKADCGSSRKEKESKEKKPAQPTKCSKKNTSVATASGIAMAQEQEKKNVLDEMKKRAKGGDLDSMYGLGMVPPASAEKKDGVGTQELTYEQIVEQVELLNPFLQCRLAKLCLEKASERGHKYARKMTEQWNYEREGEKRGDVTYFARAENTTWDSVVAEASDTRNSVNETISGEWTHTANDAPEEDVPGYQVWERDMLPLGRIYTYESGHEVVDDTISLSVSPVSEAVEEKRCWLCCLVKKWKKWMRIK